MKVLLVDDDAELLDVTSYALRREGIQIITATNGQEAIERWQQERPDVIVLDIGLPHLNGFAVCRYIREHSNVPIVFLTGFHDDQAAINGFSLGCDDYVTKPFSAKQLAMRLWAVWRRSANTTSPLPSRQLQVADLILDLDANLVRRGQEVIRLTPIQFRILHLLAANAGKVVSLERLMQFAWGYHEGDPTLLRSHISNIRRKLQLPRQGPGAIVAVSTLGYQMNA